MSPAQLLRQSQMTSTIEEDDEMESDAGPSNKVSANGNGIETPPATQQRSPWATRMRSSIPLPLDPDTLNSILGTTNTKNHSASTPAPTEQTTTKQPTLLSRKVTAVPVKQAFVPLSRPRKTGSVSSTPRPTLSKEPEPTLESSKSATIDSSSSASSTPTEPTPKPIVLESIPVTTPAISLTPSVRRSSFISPSVAPFQKLKRPARKPVTTTESATPEAETVQPQSDDSSGPGVDNESLAEKEAEKETEKETETETEKETEKEAEEEAENEAENEVENEAENETENEADEHSVLITETEHKILTEKESSPLQESDKESEPVTVVDVEDESEEETLLPEPRRSARKTVKEKIAAVQSKRRGRPRKSANPKLTEATEDAEAEAAAAESDEPVFTPPRISFKPLSTAESDRTRARKMLTRAAKRTRRATRSMPLTDDEEDEVVLIERSSDHEEFRPRPVKKIRKRKSKPSAPSTEDGTEEGKKTKKPKTKKIKVKKSTEPKVVQPKIIEYWSDGEIKRKPTPRVLKSIGSMEVKRYRGTATLDSPILLRLSEDKPPNEDGKVVIEPEDMPKYGRGYRPMAIENSEDLVINTEKFTMADICGDLPIGQQDDKFSKYEEERMKRRKKKLEIYKLKRIARAEGRSIEYISRIGNDDYDDQVKEIEEGQRQFESQYNAAPKVTISAPQMQIVGGEIQVNSESIFVDRHRQAQLELGDSREVEEETSFSKIVNNASYSKHKIAERWDKKETEKFYSALSMWGTDFTMLAQLFPGRSRRELRNKFKLEERKNRVKVDLAIERRLPTSVEDYSMAAGTPLVTVKEVQDLISEIDDDYRNRIMVETANREKARAADAENAMREDATTFGGISTQGYGRSGQRKTKAQIRKEFARNEIVLGSIDD